MTQNNIKQALEGIYTSLHNENEDIDLRIDELKTALSGEKNVTVDPSRLAIKTREGRRMMQSYFKRKGVIVTFAS